MRFPNAIVLFGTVVIFTVFLIFGLSCLSSIVTKRPGPNFIELRVTLDPGFKGDLQMEEDPTWVLDPHKEYSLTQDGTRLRVPRGLTAGGHTYVVAEVRDRTGRLLYDQRSPMNGEFKTPSFAASNTAPDGSLHPDGMRYYIRFE